MLSGLLALGIVRLPPLCVLAGQQKGRRFGDSVFLGVFYYPYNIFALNYLTLFD